MCSSVLRTEVTQPVRSLVTSVLDQFGPQKRTEVTEDRSDQGSKWMYPRYGLRLSLNFLCFALLYLFIQSDGIVCKQKQKIWQIAFWGYQCWYQTKASASMVGVRKNLDKYGARWACIDRQMVRLISSKEIQKFWQRSTAHTRSGDGLLDN